MLFGSGFYASFCFVAHTTALLSTQSDQVCRMEREKTQNQVCLLAFLLNAVNASAIYSLRYCSRSLQKWCEDASSVDDLIWVHALLETEGCQLRTEFFLQRHSWLFSVTAPHVFSSDSQTERCSESLSVYRES